MNGTKKRIELLKERNNQTIEDIYKEYRAGFLLFANRYDLDQDQCLDVYQDAIIALCENAQKGHLDDLSSSLKTYLFSIGKYMIFSEMKKTKKELNYEHLDNLQFDFEWEDYSEEKENQTVVLMRDALSKMGAKCQQMLRLFYYEEKDLDEITELMGYDNKDVTKSQKSRCVRQLKKIIETNRNE